MAINKENLGNILKFDCLQVGLDYSWGRKLEDNQWLKSFTVVDVGEVKVPVSQEDLTKLLNVSCQMPSGDGLRTAVRRVWQIDESQISTSHHEFHSVNIPKLAMRATQQLGLDPVALEVIAKPHHIFIYPSGSYYRKCRNQENEQGAFATMLLQIPVEGGHQGGETFVWLRQQMKKFITAAESGRRFHLLTFYDDCEHEIKPVIEGSRLVLVFHLFAKKSADISLSILDRPVSIRTFEDIRTTLSPWEEAESEGNFDLLAIALEHVYDKNNLLFSRLKGKDRLVARMFQSIEYVETHLAIMTKRVTGSPNFAHEDYRHLEAYFDQNVKCEVSNGLTNHVSKSNDQTDCEMDIQERSDGTETSSDLEDGTSTKNAADQKNLRVNYDFVIEMLGYLDYIEKHIGAVNTEVRKMIHEKEPTYTTDSWIDKDDRPASFRDLNIRVVSSNANDSELIGLESEIFESNRPDDELMSLNGIPHQTVLEFRYYRSFLVIWPNKRTFNIICRSGIDNGLRYLERNVKQKTPAAKEETLTNLQHLLWYCRTFPADVWGVSRLIKKIPITGQRTSRLLSLCLDLGAKQESIELLNLLGTEFEKGFFLNPNEEAVYVYEGIRTDQVAAGITALVVMLGWCTAEDAVTKLVASPQKCRWQQIGSSSTLSIKLFDYQCTEAAFTVGNLLCTQLADVDLNLLATTDFPALVSYAIMVTRLEESRQTSNPTRVFSMLEKPLEMRFMLQLAIRLFQSVGDQIKKISSCRYLYTVLCQNIVDKIDLTDKAVVSNLAEVTQCYFWLEDPVLLRSFVDKICRAVSAAAGRTILDDIMCSPGIWKMGESHFICQAMEQLIDARIEELNRMQRPEFTWEQTNAKFPDHPDVEQFLHSNKPRMIYSRFSSVTKARKFTSDYFTHPTLRNGYSATIQVGGRGENAFCEIIKTREVYNATLQKFFAYQQELKKLKSHRAASVQPGTPPPIPPAVGGKNKKNPAESQSKAAKRVK